MYLIEAITDTHPNPNGGFAMPNLILGHHDMARITHYDAVFFMSFMILVSM